MSSPVEYAVGVSYEDPRCAGHHRQQRTTPTPTCRCVYPEEGAVVLPAGVAIVKNAPNMDNTPSCSSTMC